jgi:Uncharacterized protein conserved in bacteria (DUF2330)
MGGRQAFAAASLAALVASSAGHARASGAWISGGNSLEPVEQRIAVSVGPDRTTMWTSLRFDSTAGKVGIVVPAPPGSSLDFSSDAWFEALEVATAPRVFPPEGESPYCPGQSGPPSIFDIAGQLAHAQSLPVDDVAVLDDVNAVGAWAAQSGLDLSPALASSLGALGAVRFVAVRFLAPGGPAVTRTLRVAMPGAPALLPLALTRAGAKPLLVTSWTIGEGRAEPSKSAPVTISSGDIVWDAKTKKSNYAEARAAALASEGSDGVATECAGSAPLATNVSIANGTASIEGLVSALFERTAAYGDGLVDPSSCIAAAAVALTSSSPVAASCPRADLGVIDPGVACVESTPPGNVDPAKLRCGESADDLAVALSGLSPDQVWLTRQSLEIPAGNAGVDWPLVFSGGAVVSPIRVAKNLDHSGCSGGSSTGVTSGGMSTSGVTASSSSSATGAGGMISVGVGPGFPAGAGQGGSNSTSGYETSGSGSVNAIPIDTNCGCSGTVDTYESTDTSDSCDGSSDDSSDSCSGDSSDGDSCSGDSSDGDSCSGDSSGDSCDGSSGGDSCDSGGGDLDCSGGSGDCSVGGRRGHKRSAPRFSVLSLAVIGLIAPLRRRGRRSRAAKIKRA